MRRGGRANDSSGLDCKQIYSDAGSLVLSSRGAESGRIKGVGKRCLVFAVLSTWTDFNSTLSYRKLRRWVVTVVGKDKS